MDLDTNISIQIQFFDTGSTSPNETITSATVKSEHKTQICLRTTMSRRKIPRRQKEEYSDDDESYEDERDYDDEVDPMVRGNTTVSTFMVARCQELERENKRLEMELRILKSNDRKTKRQLRIDYDWNGEEANLSDKVSNWVKTYLFARYKFLKVGWMEYSTDKDSLPSFVQRKMNMTDVDDFETMWERVIRPTMQQKYVTVRCNLNNEIRKAYKCK